MTLSLISLLQGKTLGKLLFHPLTYILGLEAGGLFVPKICDSQGSLSSQRSLQTVLCAMIKSHLGDLIAGFHSKTRCVRGWL